MVRANLTIGATMLGEASSVSTTREDDGGAVATPTCTPAVAGSLSTRTNNTQGVITADSTPSVITGDKAVVSWVDADGNLKHRYNVACTVATLAVTITGGAGDNLPDQDEVVNISKQVTAEITFDFDFVKAFFVSANVRGVLAFLDATDTEKFVMDLNASAAGLWENTTGFPTPASGTPITKVLCGSGSTSTTNFLPKILVLYDALAGSGT